MAKEPVEYRGYDALAKALGSGGLANRLCNLYYDISLTDKAIEQACELALKEESRGALGQYTYTEALIKLLVEQAVTYPAEEKDSLVQKHKKYLYSSYANEFELVFGEKEGPEFTQFYEAFGLGKSKPYPNIFGRSNLDDYETALHGQDIRGQAEYNNWQDISRAALLHYLDKRKKTLPITEIHGVISSLQHDTTTAQLSLSISRDALKQLLKQVDTEMKFAEHPLGDKKQHLVTLKLLAEALTIEPEAQKEIILQNVHNEIKDYINAHPQQFEQLFDSTGKLNQERYDTFYNAIGQGNFRLYYNTAYRVDSSIYAPSAPAAVICTKIDGQVENITRNLLEELERAELKQAGDEALIKEFLEQNFERYQDSLQGTEIELTAQDLEFSQAIDYKGLQQVIFAIHRELARPQDQQVFGTMARDFVLLKALNDHLQYNNPAFNLTNGAYVQTELIGKLEEAANNNTLPETLRPLVGVDGKIDSTEFQPLYELIGTAQQNKTYQQALNTVVEARKAGSETPSQPSSATEPSQQKKKGFSAASTNTKLGIIGTFAAATALVVGGVASQQKQDPEQPEKKNNFWPNVAIFLGIAAALGGAVWAYRVNQGRGVPWDKQVPSELNSAAIGWVFWCWKLRFELTFYRKLFHKL